MALVKWPRISYLFQAGTFLYKSTNICIIIGIKIIESWLFPWETHLRNAFVSANYIWKYICIVFFPLHLSRYDNRDGSHSHWSDDTILRGRASFELQGVQEARLTIDNVQYEDHSVYKCRVDFRMAPTSISSITLKVIGKQQFLARHICFVWSVKRGTIGYHRKNYLGFPREILFSYKKPPFVLMSRQTSLL